MVCGAEGFDDDIRRGVIKGLNYFKKLLEVWMFMVISCSHVSQLIVDVEALTRFGPN